MGCFLPSFSRNYGTWPFPNLSAHVGEEEMCGQWGQWVLVAEGASCLALHLLPPLSNVPPAGRLPSSHPSFRNHSFLRCFAENYEIGLFPNLSALPEEVEMQSQRGHRVPVVEGGNCLAQCPPPPLNSASTVHVAHSDVLPDQLSGSHPRTHSPNCHNGPAPRASCRPSVAKVGEAISRVARVVAQAGAAVWPDLGQVFRPRVRASLAAAVAGAQAACLHGAGLCCVHWCWLCLEEMAGLVAREASSTCSRPHVRPWGSCEATVALPRCYDFWPTLWTLQAFGRAQKLWGSRPGSALAPLQVS
mmetsp:Transcript_118431/g.281140  ORF Transcript_118431/g.281140 Transcript_118431/m.281140 type:complete len:303 (+) Transcript_118431:1039-1947(+)